MKKLLKIIFTLGVSLFLVGSSGLYDGPARFQLNSFDTNAEKLQPIFNAISHGQTVIILMHDNGGGLVSLQTKLRKLVEHASAPVYVISSGFIASAAFDMAFNGRPSRIFYKSILAQHSVSDGRGNPLPWVTKWTTDENTPNLFTPEEFNQLVSNGTKLTIIWSGRYACERANKAGYGVKFYATYCEFNRYDP